MRVVRAPARCGGACVLALGMLLALPAHAIFKCVDPQGNVSYQDAACPTGASERRIDTESRRDRPQDAKGGPDAPAAKDASDRAPPAAPETPPDVSETSCVPMNVNEIDAERTRSAARTAITMRLKGPDAVSFDRFYHARLKCPDGMREMACGKASLRDTAGKLGDPKAWLFALTAENYVTWTEDERGDPRRKKRMTEALAACLKIGT